MKKLEKIKSKKVLLPKAIKGGNTIALDESTVFDDVHRTTVHSPTHNFQSGETPHVTCDHREVWD